MELYAPGTRQNRSGEAGAYYFHLAQWDPRALRPGLHVLQILAADTRGNRAAAALPIRVDASVPDEQPR